jgi:hypothetical protein
MAEVVNRVEAQERVEKLTGEQRDDYFTSLLMGKDVVEDVNTSRGVFNIKYPTSADIVTIGKIAAFRRNFKPPEVFDAETGMLIGMASTLDVVVLSGPKWFEEAKNKNKNFSFLEVPSREFLSELYGKAYSFREKIEQSFDTSKRSADKPVSPEAGDDDAMGGGAFGEISSEQLDTKPN